MKNNKMLTIILIVLVVILLIGIVAAVLFLKGGDKEAATPKAPTAEELVKSSVDIEEVMTNLADKGYAKISLKIETTDEKAAEELTQRDFQVKDLVIRELSEMTRKDLEGKQGKITFTNTLMTQLNEIMQTGEVTNVYITSYLIQ